MTSRPARPRQAICASWSVPLKSSRSFRSEALHVSNSYHHRSHARALASQHKVARHERLQACELDLEVGPRVTGDVAVNDRLVVGGTGSIVHPLDQLAGGAGKVAG